MKAQKRTRAPKRRQPSAPAPVTTEPLPPALLAIAAFMGEADSDEDYRDLREALTAVRKSVQDDAGDYLNEIHVFISRWADTRNWAEQVRRVSLIDPDLPADLHNAYGVPAMLAGACLAYLILTNDRGGIR